MNHPDDIIATVGGVVFHESAVEGRVVIVVDIVDAAWFTLGEAHLLAHRLMDFTGERLFGKAAKTITSNAPERF